VIGVSRRRRFIVTEGGTLDPAAYSAERAYESLGFLMQKYATGGATFWRWTSFNSSEDSDPAFAKPVKKRGAAFSYFPPYQEMLDLAGYHLAAVPNGSFENALANGKPAQWSISGSGSGKRYRLAGTAGQPQVASRGDYALRLVTGAGAAAKVTAASALIPVDPNRTYTTTTNLRFLWTGDPNPGAAIQQRPHVFVGFQFRKADGTASTVKPAVTFRYVQEDGAVSFRTFPLRYTTPSDAAFVRILIGAARNQLPSAITFDVDNLR
jgi:hypothetical protein